MTPGAARYRPVPAPARAVQGAGEQQIQDRHQLRISHQHAEDPPEPVDADVWEAVVDVGPQDVAEPLVPQPGHLLHGVDDAEAGPVGERAGPEQRVE